MIDTVPCLQDTPYVLRVYLDWWEHSTQAIHDHDHDIDPPLPVSSLIRMQRVSLTRRRVDEKCQFETEKCQFETEKCQFETEKCQVETEQMSV